MAFVSFEVDNTKNLVVSGTLKLCRHSRPTDRPPRHRKREPFATSCTFLLLIASGIDGGGGSGDIDTLNWAADVVARDAAAAVVHVPMIWANLIQDGY